MESNYKDKRRRSFLIMGTVYNVTMGVFIFSIGVILLLNDKLGLNFYEQYDPLLIYIFSGLCLLYGGFRIYRGLRKNEDE